MAFSIFDYVGKLSEGLIRVKKGIYPNYKCGFINVKGILEIPLVFANVRDFSDGYAAVRCGNWVSDKWGFINRKGELVIPCIYNYPYPFNDGYAKVIYNGEWFFINKKGDRIISLNEWDSSSKFSNGYATAWKYDDRRRTIEKATIDSKGIIVYRERIIEEL